jgi:outer membrane protein OmpA-like peptidoglycan-associated protein/Tol biopolymer transport system component
LGILLIAKNSKNNKKRWLNIGYSNTVHYFHKKILFFAILCSSSFSLYAQQGSTTSDEVSAVKKNGFLSSLVVDESGMPLIVKIDIKDNSTNKVVQQLESSRIGYSRISLPSGNYNIVFSKSGYLFHSENFILPDSAGFEKKLKKVILKKVQVGSNTQLNNISFEENAAVLKESSFTDLERVIELMNEIVSLQIELTGTVDEDMSSKTRDELAEQRAKVLINYLVSKGIDKDRLQYKGINAEKPIAIVGSDDTQALDESEKISFTVVKIENKNDVAQSGGAGSQYGLPDNSTKKKPFGKKNKPKTELVQEKTDTVATTPVAVEPVPENKNSDSEPVVANATSVETNTTSETKEDKVVAVEPVQEKKDSDYEPIVTNTTSAETNAMPETKEDKVLVAEPVQEKKDSDYEPVVTNTTSAEKNATPETKEDKVVVTAEPVQEKKENDSESVVTSTTSAETNATPETPETKDDKVLAVVEPAVDETKDVVSTPAIEKNVAPENLSPVVEKVAEEPKKEEPVVVATNEKKTDTLVEPASINTILNKISFENNESVLKESSLPDLDRVIKLMNEIVSLEIEIPVTVDEDLSVKNKSELAEQRAKVLINYLVSKGIDRSRLKFKGENSEQPIQLVETDANKANEENSVDVAKVDNSADTSNEAKDSKAIESSTDIVALPEDVEQKNTVETPASVDEKKPEALVENKAVEESKSTESVEKSEPVKTKQDEIVSENKVSDTSEKIDSKNEEVAEPSNKSEDSEKTKDVVVAVKEDIKPIVESPIKSDSVVKDSLLAKKIPEIPVDTTVYTLENIKLEMDVMDNTINTPFPDYAPLVSADGNTLVFTSRRPINKKDIEKKRIGNENIYITKYDTKAKVWADVERLDATVNVEGADNIATSLSIDGQKMLICRAKSEQNPNADIYESILKGDEWTEPTKLLAPINTSAEETYACYSPDGMTIYFVSDRKGGRGGKDVWASTKDKSGKWGTAVNLGAAVNSVQDEATVFAHPNGQSLFFSSQGHGSVGGLDLFSSTLNDATGKWEKITNLGASINTTADDMHFVITANAKTAYYATYSSTGDNDISIVNFEDTIVANNIIVLKGSVIDEHGRFIKSKITFADQLNDKPIGLYSSNRATGKYLVTLSGGKNYNVRFSAKGYSSFVEPVETKGLQYGEFSKIILLESKNTSLLGKIVDVGGSPLNALVEVLDKSNKQWIEKVLTDEEGAWTIDVPAGKSLGVVVSKPGYFFQSINVTMPNAIGYEKNFKSISLTKIEKGKKIVLNNVSFESGKAILKPEVFSDLDLVSKLMTDMATLEIEISDNANNLSKSKENQKISTERAKAVADYLINRGCDAKRIKFASYETKEPIIVNDKKADSFLSRIELKVLKLNDKTEAEVAENRTKEIAEDIKRLADIDAFGEPDSLSEEGDENIDGGEYTEDGGEVTDTAIVSEYANLDTTDVETDGFSEDMAGGEQVDSLVTSSMDTVKVEVLNLGSLINSPFKDYIPLITADGKQLLFTSARPEVFITADKLKKKQPDYKNNVYAVEYDENTERWKSASMLKVAINNFALNNTAIALSNDGKKMLLYQTPDKSFVGENINEATSPAGEWGLPSVVLSAINGPSNETSACYSPDGKTVYFVSDRQGGAGMKDIWYCTQNDKGVWGEAVNMGEPINTDKDEESVFLHPNGSTLFFSSMGHKSLGGFDVFMSEHIDSSDTWEQPISLGANINTVGDELNFVLSADGKTAYYSADRPEGFGKEDIYQLFFEQSFLRKNTVLLKGRVVDEIGEALRAKIILKDKTLGKVIGSFNSDSRTGNYMISLPEGKNYEIKVYVPEHTSYVRSIDLTNTKKYDELTKNIVLETKNAFISSKVTDDKGKSLEKVKIELIDKKAKLLIERAESDSEGYSRIAIPSNKEIDVLFKKPGYLFQSVSVSLPKYNPTDELNKDLKTITLHKMEVNQKIVLNNVTFDPLQSNLTQESFLDLSRIVSMLNEAPSLHIEISDHTDSKAVSKEMQKLSKERAKAVADRLITMGADKKRIRFKSYGDSDPIATNESEQGRALNNRVELKILKIDAQTELAEAEKRAREEATLVEQPENDSPFGVESLIENKDSVANTIVDNKVVKDSVSTEINKNEPVNVLKEEPKPVVEEPVKEEVKEPVVTPTEEPTNIAKEEPIVEEPVKEEVKEPLVTPTEEPTNIVKEEPKSVVEEPVKEEVKEPLVTPTEEPTNIVKEEPKPVVEEPVKEEVKEPVVTPTEEPTNIAKEEPKPIVEEPVNEEVKEPVVTPTEEPTNIAKEEPKPIVEEPVKEEVKEPVVTPTEEPTNIAKEEPKPVVEEPVKEEVKEPAVTPTEEPTNIAKEEPKSVVEEPVKEEVKEPVITPTEEPTNIVKEEPKPVVEEPVKEEVKSVGLPERFVKYDKDKDGIISYKEIMNAIDNFFDDDAQTNASEISEMIDYFFDSQ